MLVTIPILSPSLKLDTVGILNLAFISSELVSGNCKLFEQGEKLYSKNLKRSGELCLETAARVLKNFWLGALILDNHQGPLN